ncbi:MAG: PKD-like domain-containing protein [Niabella sp.]
MKQKVFYIVLLAVVLITSCRKQEYLAPVVSGAGAGTDTLNIGDKLVLAPDITNLKGNNYTWLVNGKEVATGEVNYIFTATEPGDFTVTFRAGNKGGTGEQAFKVFVEKPLTIALQNTFTVPKCKVLEIAPTISGPDRNDYKYEWVVGDSIIGQAPAIDFISVKEGNYSFALKVTAGKQTATTTCNVTVENAEYSAYATKLLDYMPSNANGSSFNWVTPFANGTQFLNTYNDYLTALSQYIKTNPLIDLGLGWWGGYAVYGFDHTIVDVLGKSDIQLFVNDYYPSYPSYFVAYDKNKNGIPDDEWYEIKTSVYGTEDIKDYQVTLSLNTQNIDQKQVIYEWKDNQGTEKAWSWTIPSESAALSVPGNYYTNNAVKVYDGWKNSYTLKGKMIKTSITRQVLYKDTKTLDITNAVDQTGAPVRLQGIDFLKVQNMSVPYFRTNTDPITGINQRISGVKDINL